MAYDKNLMDMIKLASCVINQRTPDEAWRNSLDLKGIFDVSRKYMLEALIAAALEYLGISNEQFQIAKAKAIQKSVIFDAERKKILHEFEKQGIWYLPLKGIILQNYYPGVSLRQMADNDIMIDPDRRNDVKSIMEKLGYETIDFGMGIHDVYHKNPIVSFEMHFSLVAEYQVKSLYDYYLNIDSKLIPAEDGTYARHFSKEDFYLYLIAHEYKHFCKRGIGIRSLVDTYVYLRKEELNMEYVLSETKRMGISDFERKNRALAMHLFDGKELSMEDQEMFIRFVKSGTFGNLLCRTENVSQRKGWGRFQYALHRFMIPISKKNVDYIDFAEHYPFFYKWKIFLPVLPFYRILKAAKEKRLQIEVNVIKRMKRK